MALKVLNVTVSLNPKGGGWPERTIQMSKALAETGTQCSILTFDEGYTCEFESIQVIALPASVKGAKLAWFLPLSSLQNIKDLIASVDVVHLMGFRSFLNMVVYRYAKSQGKPVVVCPAGSLPSYGNYANRFLKSVFDTLAGNSMVKNVDACIAITDKEKEVLIEHGFSRNSVDVFPNAVFKRDFLSYDNNGFHSKYHIGNAKFILFLGRLTHIKGPDLLLKAFANLGGSYKQYHLVFAGPDAGMQGELEADVESLLLDGRVHFIGHIDQPDKSHAYHAAELIVIPSRQEAMSIVALEGGICGTPVMLTDACGFDEMAEVDERLVVDASIEGLSEGLERLLASGVDLKQLGDSLAQFIVNRYSWEVIVHRYLILYKKLAGR